MRLATNENRFKQSNGVDRTSGKKRRAQPAKKEDVPDGQWFKPRAQASVPARFQHELERFIHYAAMEAVVVMPG